MPSSKNLELQHKPHKVRAPPKPAHSFSDLKQSIEKALKGSDIGTGINELGEVIFKPGTPKKQAEESGTAKQETEKKMKNILSTGIPSFERLIEEKRFAGIRLPEIDRIKTGIPGLDELITGGIPRQSTVLLAGSPGAGKSIFAMQFLVNGAELFGEAGLYISFEEDPASLRETGMLFGWDIEKLEKQKKIKIIFEDPYEIKSFAAAMSGQIYNTLRETNAKRIVFDSITYMGVTQDNQYKLRKHIAELGRRLKKMDISTLFISESPEGPNDPRIFKMDEFAADGVIRLYNLLIKGTRQRAIEIVKLRKTNHDTFLHPFIISEKGIVAYPKEQVFNE